MTGEQARKELHDNFGCTSDCRREGCPDYEMEEPPKAETKDKE